MNKKLSDLSDDALIEMYRQGEVYAFDVLLKRYVPYIMYWIHQSTSNENDVNDFFQEISLHISEKLKFVYEGRGYFPAWIHCVVCNYLHSTYRKKHLDWVLLSTELLNNSKLVCEENGELPAENYLLILEKILKEQPEHIQQLIRMRFWSNYTYQEISEITGIHISTVVKRLKTAYMKLRKQMKEQGMY